MIVDMRSTQLEMAQQIKSLQQSADPVCDNHDFNLNLKVCENMCDFREHELKIEQDKVFRLIIYTST